MTMASPIEKTLHVTTPSRLHFGLFAFGNTQKADYQFGGVGVMVRPPSTTIRISGARAFASKGVNAERIGEWVQRWSAYHGRSELPTCLLEVLEAPPEHCGLGTGTQLALAVAAGLNAWHGHKLDSPAQLARSVGRGKRSAIGTYGFGQGGLLVDRGKRAGDALGQLEARVALPEAWRFVLLRPPTGTGLSGADEQAAFAELPAVSPQITDQLRHEVFDHLLPSAREADCERFGESLYRYGLLVGECFAARQGGPFASPDLADWVGMIRGLGVRGVGQSSWGPTLFALLPDPIAAEKFVDQFQTRVPVDATKPIVGAVDNHGARMF